jgi:hypothetical protein
LAVPSFPGFLPKLDLILSIPDVKTGVILSP